MSRRHSLATFAFAAVVLSAAVAHAENTGQYIDDATVTTKVKAELLADSGLKGTSVKVTTNHGVVDLEGSVTSASQSELASRDAAKVDGVKSVTNDLKVGG